MKKSRLESYPFTDLDMEELRMTGAGVIAMPDMARNAKLVTDTWNDIVEWAPSFWEAVKRGFYEGVQDGKNI